jgi:hypothetical protein
MGKYILVHGIRVAKDFTPETFGRLTTIGPAFKIGKNAFVVCQCKCGFIKIVRKTNLGRCAFSCGCLHKEELAARSTKHGERKKKETSAEYNCYMGILKRCKNSNDVRFPLYGGRGIKICDRWLGDSGFQNFLADMGRKPSRSHSIDRIDVNGDYCYGNCRWATQKEQNNNKRNNLVLTAFGRSQTMSQWADELGIPYNALEHRIARKWSIEKALSTPVKS